MKRFVSSTIWLPVTTTAAIAAKVQPACFMKSSVVFLTAPMLQLPQPLHLPVQARRPESTGCVLWYVQCSTLPAYDIITAL